MIKNLKEHPAIQDQINLGLELPIFRQPTIFKIEMFQKQEKEKDPIGVCVFFFVREIFEPLTSK